MQSAAADDSVCYHCGLPIEPAALMLAPIKGTERSFCCSGCMLVCQTIHDSGLDGFYDKLKTNEALAPPPSAAANDFEQFDPEDIQAEFVTISPQGVCDATLLVEGIHCAACVWLIEKALKGLDGVVSADVNMAHHRLRLRWQQDQVKLSAVLKRLAQIGYKAVPYNPEVAEGAAARVQKALLYRMAFAGFGMMNIMWISIALFSASLSASGIDPDHKQFFHTISFLLATPVLFYSGWTIMRGAVRGLMQRQLSMDLPITIGALATYAYSTWITYRGFGDVYFDTVVTFLFIILVGRYLEGLSRKNATSATHRLMELQPRSALRYNAAGETEMVSVRSLRLGDRVLVRPGDKVAVDGRVIEGHTEIDEAMLTGEAKPVAKHVGSLVVAGTVNGQGALVVEVEKLGADTALAKIIHMVENAQGSKAPVQCLADRVVPWFVASTIGLALITFLFWVRQDFDVALLAATSVLIITCPCAFGLATPMGIAVGVGHASRNGVLVKNGGALETLSTVDHVVFDKTGTLTEGHLTVESVHLAADAAVGREQLLSLAAAAESRSEHHISKSIVEYAKREKCFAARSVIENFSAVPGMGIQADVDGHRVAVGNAALLRQSQWQASEELLAQAARAQAEGSIAVYVAIDQQVLAVLVISDHVRDDAASMLATLRARGIGVTLLTGDSQAAAEHVATALGGMDVIAQVLPQDKAQVIANLQAQGKKVAMVGDGINDAPALSKADVGIAMGCGTDVSLDCADFVLMDNSLQRLLFAMDLSRDTLKIIRQNIRFSLGYNMVLVPICMAAMLTPVFAAIAMPLSSLAVIGNAVRIRRMCRVEQ